MWAATTRRVAENTDEAVNIRIRARMRARVIFLAERPDLIPAQLAALDREWDIERTLEANAATLGLIGAVVAARADSRLFAIPALISGFLLQHALQGWCPPVPVLRRLGVRTATEIAAERTALRWLRGDFSDVPQSDAMDPLTRALRALRVAEGGD
ncbi:conserved hypothetical protein [uncultured Alphaproteobacteria bacterium]|uniref:DUF2892 domain-containing protein n=1 Tax=uncultured Alphaproteobacteria bacterium TaxID=91750 RepID=A0A212JVY6_9PROT|nr:conserved hypothetical protein [uncultured Alphaproteobacteria bacterium]